MSSSRFRPELYRTLIHPAMSVSVSVTAVLTTVWLIAATIGLDPPGVGVVVAVIAAALIEASVGNLLYRERAGIGNRVRELIIYLIVVYLVASLGRPGALVGRFEPALAQVIPVLAAALTWLIGFVLHNRLRGREALLRAFHGKHDDELRHAVLDRQHDMTVTMGELRQARKLIGALFFAHCLIAVLGSFEFMPEQVRATGVGAFVLLVLYGITAVASMGALNTFMEEYAANGEGMTVPLRFGRRRAIIVTVLIALVFGAAFALSRSNSLLPLDAIVRFFEWLGSLFEREAVEAPPPPLPPLQQSQLGPNFAELLGEAEPYVPPLWLRLLLELLRRLLVGALITGAIVLIFGPLVSPAFRDGLRRLRPGEALRNLMKQLKARWRVLKRLLKAGRRRRRGQAEESAPLDPDSRGYATWKPSIRKKRQMDRVVTVFVSVTNWGARRGINYQRSEAAQEYLRRVSALHPEAYADARLVGEVLYEARFSRQLVSFSRMRDYAQAARRIVRIS